MDITLILFVTLFVLIMSATMFYLVRHQDVIMAWRIRSLNEGIRQDYIHKNKEALLESMRHHRLIIYVDEALDEAYARVSERYREDYQRTYLQYPEKSYELAILEGHDMTFDAFHVELLVWGFCFPRYLLLNTPEFRHELVKYRQDKKESSPPFLLSNLIFSYLLALSYPHIDHMTRAEQRRALTES